MDMLILLTNDDGINAEGLNVLARELGPLGELVVVAPQSPRNAASRSFSLDRPVRYQELGGDRFAVDGTPVDCVYLALHHLLIERSPDLVISGINHGPNLAQDVTYSGTVGAAMEAADNGFPAAAISLAVRQGPFIFEPAARFVRDTVVPLLLRCRLPRGVFFNVNVPGPVDGGPSEAPSWRFTTLGRHSYRAAVVPAANPRGRPFFWLGGTLGGFDPLPRSDCVAIAEGVTSITPLGLDLTATACLQELLAAGQPQADVAAEEARPAASSHPRGSSIPGRES